MILFVRESAVLHVRKYHIFLKFKKHAVPYKIMNYFSNIIRSTFVFYRFLCNLRNKLQVESLVLNAYISQNLIF